MAGQNMMNQGGMQMQNTGQGEGQPMSSGMQMQNTGGMQMRSAGNPPADASAAHCGAACNMMQNTHCCGGANQ